MGNKRWLVLILVAAMLIGVSSDAFAWGRRPKEKSPNVERSGMRKPDVKTLEKKLSKDLGLTQKQKDKFKANAKATEKEVKEIRAKNKELQKKLREEMQKEAPDRNKVHQYIKERGKLQTDIQIERMDSMLELRKSLAPEQKEKFKNMLRKKDKSRFGKKNNTRGKHR